jgi:hypothetical protein
MVVDVASIDREHLARHPLIAVVSPQCSKKLSQAARTVTLSAVAR